MLNNKTVEPKDSVKQIEPYEVPLFSENYNLKLDSNENIFGCSNKVYEALQNLTSEQISRYPHYGVLTEKISEYISVPSEYIKVTNGADEALFALIQTYLSEKDAMITVTPTFSMPKLYANIIGASVIEIPYQKRWDFPINEFITEIQNNPKIKIVHITSPNNPTGECLPMEYAEKIISVSKDKLVIFDETYASYCKKSMISKVKEYDNIAVVKSFSKDFALAGLRIGYIITKPERIKILKTVISPYSVNIAAATAAEAALCDLEHLAKIKKEIKKSKEILSLGLQKLGFEVFPSEANFVLFDAGQKAEYVYHTLLKHGIKVRKFSAKQMQGLIRITAPDCINSETILSLLQPKKTLIFDMDGVLVDVSKSYRTTVKMTYEHFAGKNLDYEEITKAKNLGGLNNDWDLTEYLLKKDGTNVDKNQIIDIFEKIYFDNGKGLINREEFLFDKELIQELSQKYNLCIFTGRPKTEADYTLETNGVKKYFYPII
ncbi:MAG: histidinol-phosphate transaminase, partial [Candidatus Gastranaerophilaceae bacterium]